MDSPMDRLRNQAANRNTNRRDPRRRRRRDPRQEPERAPDEYRNQSGGGGNNNGGGGGGGGGNPLGKKWGKYQPRHYNPLMPYNGGTRGRSAQSTGFGRYLAELDPEAAAVRKLGKMNIGYRAAGGNTYDQYIRDQTANAMMGLRAARLDRPNIKVGQYLNRLPAWRRNNGNNIP